MLEGRLAARAAAERAGRQAARMALAAKKKATAETRKKAAAAAETRKKAPAAHRKAAAARRAALATAYSLPVSGYRLTAGFGAGGSHWANGHTGLDFAAPLGTAVGAVAPGTIVESGWDGAYGNRLSVRHLDGTETWYCHLSGFVRTSGTVAAGEIIGRVGGTGNATGPHLHLEVHPGGGAPVDPYAWLVNHGLRP